MPVEGFPPSLEFLLKGLFTNGSLASWDSHGSDNEVVVTLTFSLSASKLCLEDKDGTNSSKIVKSKLSEGKYLEEGKSKSNVDSSSKFDRENTCQDDNSKGEAYKQGTSHNQNINKRQRHNNNQQQRHKQSNQNVQAHHQNNSYSSLKDQRKRDAQQSSQNKSRDQGINHDESDSSFDNGQNSPYQHLQVHQQHMQMGIARGGLNMSPNVTMNSLPGLLSNPYIGRGYHQPYYHNNQSGHTPNVGRSKNQQQQHRQQQHQKQRSPRGDQNKNEHAKSHQSRQKQNGENNRPNSGSDNKNRSKNSNPRQNTTKNYQRHKNQRHQNGKKNAEIDETEDLKGSEATNDLLLLDFDENCRSDSETDCVDLKPLAKTLPMEPLGDWSEQMEDVCVDASLSPSASGSFKKAYLEDAEHE